MDYMIYGMVLLAALLVFLPKVSKITQYISTLFHEVGHVIASFVTGGGASSIHIRMDTSGVAGTSHKVGVGGLFSRTVTLLSGYATPVNYGAVLIGLSFTPWVDVGIGIIIAFSVIALLLIRNLFGFLVTSSFLALLGLLIFLPIPVTHAQIVLFFGSLVFLNGVRDVIKIAPHVAKSRVREEEMSDFHILASTSLFPPLGWFIIFCIGEVGFFGAIIFGATVLYGR